MAGLIQRLPTFRVAIVSAASLRSTRNTRSQGADAAVLTTQLQFTLAAVVVMEAGAKVKSSMAAQHAEAAKSSRPVVQAVVEHLTAKSQGVRLVVPGFPLAV